jgi:hypothetical protein
MCGCGRRRRRKQRSRDGELLGQNGLRQRLRRESRGSLRTAFGSFLAILCAQPRLNDRPLRLPAVITDNVTQGKHRVHMGTCPMHTSPLQTSFDHYFIGAFHSSAADGPSLLHKEMVLLWSRRFSR